MTRGQDEAADADRADETAITEALALELEQIEPLPRFDEQGAHDRAVAAEAAARAIDASVACARAELVQADVLLRRGRLTEGGRVAHRLLQWSTEHNEPYVAARSHLALEDFYCSLGDETAAFEHALKAVELLPPSASPAIHFDHHFRLAVAMAHSGDMTSARDRFEQVLELAEPLGPAASAFVLNNMAWNAHLMGEYATALEIVERAHRVELPEGVEHGWPLIDTTARVLVSTGRPDAARRFVEQALEDGFHGSDGHVARAECLLLLAELRRAAGELLGAQLALTECHGHCRAGQLDRVGLRAQEEQAHLLAASGRYRDAYVEHVRFHEESAKRQTADREARVRALQAVFEVAEARQESRRYRRMSLTDPLTGLANRRGLSDQLPALLEACASGVHPVTVAVLDLDHFKRVNDTASHAAGDLVLREVAGMLRAAAASAPRGLAARTGGEEFVLVFPQDRSAARGRLDDLAAAVRTFDWRPVCGPVPVTLSIGATTARAGTHPTEGTLMSAADDLLYQAKHAGRDRVVDDAAPRPGR